MTAQEWGLLLGGVGTLTTAIGTGLGWFLKWYADQRKADKTLNHQLSLEEKEANHKREKERSSELRSVETSLVRQWKSYADRQDKQWKEYADRQDKRIEFLIADGERKQSLLDQLVRRERRCTETFIHFKEWTRYANERLKSLDSEWKMDPPDLDLGDEFDSEFHARSSAQDTAVIKAMPKEQMPSEKPPERGNERPGGGR